MFQMCAQKCFTAHPTRPSAAVIVGSYCYQEPNEPAATRSHDSDVTATQADPAATDCNTEQTRPSSDGGGPGENPAFTAEHTDRRI